MATSKAQKAATSERRKQAIALRIAGMDWQTIADRLAYADRGAACKDVSRALKKNLKEEGEQADLLRHMTVQRYDRLQSAYWAQALKGDARAADIVLKCLAGRSKIEGTEAPNKLAVSAAITYELVGLDPADLV
jgi:hypothetical protein